MSNHAELNRIVSLLDDLQQGECWIGNNAEQVLNGIDAKTAAKKGYDGGNSIWQLVHHITFWRKHVVKRIEKGMELPFEGPEFYQPPNPSEESWNETVQDFKAAYHLLREAILSMDGKKLDQPLEGEGIQYTYYKQIMGVMQHDAWHLGQIILIRKMHAVQGANS